MANEGELLGVSRIKLHEGKVEQFKQLCAQFVEIVRTEDTGTLQFEIYFNDDQSEAVVLERYRDGAALFEHAAHIGDLNQALQETGSVSADLFGDPSTELRASLAGAPIGIFTPFMAM